MVVRQAVAPAMRGGELCSRWADRRGTGQRKGLGAALACPPSRFSDHSPRCMSLAHSRCWEEAIARTRDAGSGTPAVRQLGQNLFLKWPLPISNDGVHRSFEPISTAPQQERSPVVAKGGAAAAMVGFAEDQPGAPAGGGSRPEPCVLPAEPPRRGCSNVCSTSSRSSSSS
eukprot:scaffold32561_cov112-Isochrysis_galbana.AAC.1